MRILIIAVAFVLVVLSTLGLVPDALLAPYGETIRAVLPKAMSLSASVLFLALLAERVRIAPVTVASRAEPEPVPEPAQPLPAAAPLPPAAPAINAEAEVVSFLALLQDKGRLVDFLMDDVTPYSDAQVGAAARVLHQGCRAVLTEHFSIRPVRDEAEGARITVPAGFAADEYRLVGRIGGEAPFSGTLIHHGWRTESVRLPRLVRADEARLPAIAPAEIELR
ncbi:DUF2760 domain-containing protein [Magnetospirillum molischianum]|uniref:DUF2760 domain-containing protein n=1 Tax=Magnetospirillum molischianum TaxID=1083 RepID=UPI00030F9E2C|nr:DUF2760 domain-containing protein [Magnetospirillum molischianum]